MTAKQEAIQDMQVELREYNLHGGGVRRIERMGRILDRLIDIELKRKGVTVNDESDSVGC